MTIEREPAAHGGLVATHELHARGFDRAAISSAVRAGRIRRQRQGWYSSVDLARSFAQAVRVGGVATCATALAAAGVWVLAADVRLHVAVKPTACQLRSPRDSRERLGAQDVVIHWTLTDQVDRLTRSLADSLIDYAACATPELLGGDRELAVARASGIPPPMVGVARQAPGENAAASAFRRRSL